MWTSRYFRRIDFRIIILVFLLMSLGLITLSSYSVDTAIDIDESSFFTPLVRSQLRWYIIGWGLFFLTAGFDYNKLREWAPFLYVITLIALIGLFFTESIQRVHRWYRLPFVNFNAQPSEGAKLTLVIFMSWFLEKRAQASRSLLTAFYALLIAFIPFLLIVKQPDLGTALILFPITLVMFYFGDIHPWIIKILATIACSAIIFVSLIFSGIIPYNTVKPYALQVLKEYQFERLNPETHHQKASQSAIAIGGITGVGYRSSKYSAEGSLPAACTDSIFPAFGEEFGLLGLALALFLFYSLVYCSFQVSAVAKDLFGRLLAAGISVYLAIHVLVNIGMMSGFLPITGVPLIFMSYGGSSIMATMLSLGILQSIYSRRFMF